MTAPRRIGLVGCVKQKRAIAAPAKDPYTSPLFRGRRAYVERTCDRWFILSAEHGLVEADAVLAPYAKTLKRATTAERRTWSDRVLGDLDPSLDRSPDRSWSSMLGLSTATSAWRPFSWPAVHPSTTRYVACRSGVSSRFIDASPAAV